MTKSSKVGKSVVGISSLGSLRFIGKEKVDANTTNVVMMLECDKNALFTKYIRGRDPMALLSSVFPFMKVTSLKAENDEGDYSIVFSVDIPNKMLEPSKFSPRGDFLFTVGGKIACELNQLENDFHDSRFRNKVSTDGLLEAAPWFSIPRARANVED